MGSVVILRDAMNELSAAEIDEKRRWQMKKAKKEEGLLSWVDQLKVVAVDKEESIEVRDGGE